MSVEAAYSRRCWLAGVGLMVVRLGRLARHDDGVGGVVLRGEGVVSGKKEVFKWLVERGSFWVVMWMVALVVVLVTAA